MNWGRSKTILIILFLLIDIILLTLLSVLQNDIQFIKKKTIEETVDVLNDNNISIMAKQIPAKRELNKTLQIQNLLHQPKQMAERFFGDKYITVRENEVESYYKKGDASLCVYNTDFSFEKVRKKNYTFSFEETKGALYKDLKKFGYDTESIVIKRHYIDDGICYISALHAFETNEILSSEIEITADKDGILKMSGKCMVVKDFIKSGENLSDITSVLVGMIYNPLYKGINIEKIQTGYDIDSEHENSFDITGYPVYIITDSEDREYILNAF